jgi:ATP synthase protein I
VTNAEPERELVRRALPLAPAAALVAFVLGYAAGGWGAAWSAAIGVAIVTVNFVASALSIAWAAGISLTILAAVALGGFVVRLIAIVIALVALNTLAWFSPLAFALALVPSTVVLLVYEAKALSGRMQVDLWSFEGARR